MDETAINRLFWLVIVIAFVVLLGIGGGFFYFFRLQSQNLDELEQVNASNNDLKKKIASLRLQKEEMDRNRADARAYEAFLPSEDDIPGMFDKIARTAVEKNLLLDYAAVAIPTSGGGRRGKKKDIYETRVFNFTLLGKYPDVISFINAVERMDRFVMVNQVSLAPATVSKTMTAEEWVDPSRPPYLNFSILIYTFVYSGG